MKRICYLLICMITMILSSCNDFTKEDLQGSWYYIGNAQENEQSSIIMISFKKNDINMYFSKNVLFGKYEIQYDNVIKCKFDNYETECKLEVMSFDKDYTNESLHNAHGRMYLKMYLDDVLFMDFDCVKQFE